MVEFPKGPTGFSILWQWLRFAAIALAFMIGAFFLIKANCHVIDIEFDIHGYLERLYEEVIYDREMHEVSENYTAIYDLNNSQEMQD